MSWLELKKNRLNPNIDMSKVTKFEDLEMLAGGEGVSKRSVYGL
jgi:hypothetical protein